MVALIVVVSHWSLVWHHAVPDFDTDTLIGYTTIGVCSQPWIVKGMGDSAHPLGNAFLTRWACLFEGNETVTPSMAWYALICAAVLVTVALLVLLARAAGGGLVAAVVALGYLGTSPVLRTLSSRAEENWIGMALFVVVTMVVMAAHTSPPDRRARWLLAVGGSTLVLAVWHSQYVLVLAFGLAPWGLLAFVRPSWVGTTSRQVLELATAMALPAVAAIGLLFGSGYATRVPYHRMFFSVFNPDAFHGIGTWSLDYVAYSGRWLTGWAGNDGMEEKLFAAPEGVAHLVLGAFALLVFVVLVVTTRNTVLMAAAFGALLLTFLFEPHNAERWDPVVAVTLMALAHGAYLRPSEAVTTPTEKILVS
ncbi:hypothetical protein [Nocardioides exalbidus]|uniref:hypothetical protein n=1 Tax=Nocardioides exalbidus TaxID=402596 RepID=UPI000B86D9B4|nr:hypothetical protein [Nocardioides exalbidus]